MQCECDAKIDKQISDMLDDSVRLERFKLAITEVKTGDTPKMLVLKNRISSEFFTDGKIPPDMQKHSCVSCRRIHSLYSVGNWPVYSHTGYSVRCHSWT